MISVTNLHAFWKFVLKYKYGIVFYGNILFCIFCTVFFMNKKIYTFKINLFCKFSINISNYWWLFFTGFKCVTKHHLNHLLSSFWILINPLIELLSNGKIWTTFARSYFWNNKLMLKYWMKSPTWTFLCPVFNSHWKVIVLLIK